MNISNELILASSSPQRKKILEENGIVFTVCPADTDETYPENICLEDVPVYIAQKKAEAVAKKLTENKDRLILAADTVIIFEGKILGKPENEKKAFEYIFMLQGREHKTVTGLALFNPVTGQITCRKNVNKVFFTEMDFSEIKKYISLGEWKNAAGGYRIQGKAVRYIKRIEGSESGIIGLPVFELYDILREQNYSL